MTGAALAAALVERGLDRAELPEKQSIFDLVLAGHAALDEEHAADAAEHQPHAWWVPGRLEVFGTHTDYAGGHTLVCAVPRGFAVLARRRTDDIVRVVDALRQQEVSLRPSDELSDATAASHEGWRRYVAVVCRRLARNFPGAALGADIVLASDLPRASGMSSSSALVIASAAALGAVGDVRRHRAWQANVRTPLDAAAYYACIENGLPFG